MIRSTAGDIKFLKQINETASEIFKFSDGSNTIDKISKNLSEKYNQNYEEVLNIVKEFIYVSKLNDDIELLDTPLTRKVDILGSIDWWRSVIPS